MFCTTIRINLQLMETHFSKYLDAAENQTFGQRQETRKAPAADDGRPPGAP